MLMINEKYGIKIFELKNSPVNWYENFQPRNLRKNQILVIGYFSPIKNQLAALKILVDLPQKYKINFIGDRKGQYFRLCKKTSVTMGLEDRVLFSQNREMTTIDRIMSKIAN